jgi:hypothetical protein
MDMLRSTYARRPGPCSFVDAPPHVPPLDPAHRARRGLGRRSAEPRRTASASRSLVPAARAGAPPSDAQYFARRSEGIRGCRDRRRRAGTSPLSGSDCDWIVAARNHVMTESAEHKAGPLAGAHVARINSLYGI